MQNASSHASWSTAVTWWIMPLSLSAAIVTQLFHESIHAVTGRLVGARVNWFSFYMVQTSWPAGAVDTEWKDGIVAGSAALANIALALAGVALWHRSSRAALRLFLFYLTAYSLFMGFGYLFIDPLRASPEALGDWARVVMLLGGGLLVRMAIGAVGGGGTVWGYFWMGRAAHQFTYGDMTRTHDRRWLGVAMCLVPYFTNNLWLTVLAVWQGSEGAWMAIFAYWGSYIGFFWAFMIRFVWSDYAGPYAGETSLPARRAYGPWLLAGLLIALLLTWLADGFPVG